MEDGEVGVIESKKVGHGRLCSSHTYERPLNPKRMIDDLQKADIHLGTITSAPILC